MSDDKIQYDILALDAMRGVMRAVLQRVQRRGLPGDHHFYISFATHAPGVQISKRLKERYPDEMTIVMQHQFWDLLVTDERFEVKLSFNNVPERLVIPFSAVRQFHDPSVDYKLIFEGVALRTPVPGGAGSRIAPPMASVLPDLAANEFPAREAPTAAKHAPKPPAADEEDFPPDEPKKGAEIVKLDSFRKK